MKNFAVILFIFVTTIARGESPDEILTDYRTKAGKACEKLNETLRREGEAAVKHLIALNLTKEATTAAEQVEAKIANQAVPTPHPELKQLFAQFESARESALKPIRSASVQRLDALLKTSSANGMANLVRIAECKAQIESGAGVLTSSSPNTAQTPPRNYLQQNKIPKVWGYYLSADAEKRYGTFTLNNDGTILINAASPGSGTWVPTKDATVLLLDIKNAAGVPEKTELRITGKEATMKRVSGMRYLKAD